MLTLSRYDALTSEITTLSADIRRIRKLRGMTQEQLASRIGITRVHLSRLERGDAQPRLGTLEAIVEVLGLDDFQYGVTAISDGRDVTNVRPGRTLRGDVIDFSVGRVEVDLAAEIATGEPMHRVTGERALVVPVMEPKSEHEQVVRVRDEIAAEWGIHSGDLVKIRWMIGDSVPVTNSLVYCELNGAGLVKTFARLGSQRFLVSKGKDGPTYELKLTDKVRFGQILASESTRLFR